MSKKKKLLIGMLVPIAIVGIVKVNFNQAADIGFNTFIAYWASKVPGMEVYELTEAEKKWLKAKFGDEERIEKGRLYESEAIELEKGRQGLSVLEEKYPGYHFRITWLDRYDTWTSFTVYEEITGEKVVMNVEEDEESSYEVKDDFYGYFIEDEYGDYLEKQFKQSVENVVKIEISMIFVRGREYDISMTMEDLLKGSLELNPLVHVFVSAKNMKEKECVQCEEKLQKTIEEINLPGIYNIYFYDMAENEMLMSESYGECIYRCTIHL